MPGILFVSPGPDAERAVFADEGRGLWSAALPVVLEKHGYLSFEEAPPAILAEADTVAGYDVVLVARGRDDPWEPESLKALAERGVPILMDGPSVPTVREQLGITEVAAIEPEGSIQVRDRDLRLAAARFCSSAGARIEMPKEHSGAAGRPWHVANEVPITEAQAAGWRACPWDAEAWPAAFGGRVLLDWIAPADGLRTPAMVRWDSIVACSFGLFGFLAYTHTVAPLGRGVHQSSSRSLPAEAALLGTVDLLHRQRRAVRARLRPWPAGVPFVVSVRHDVTGPGGQTPAEVIAADSEPSSWTCPADASPDVAAAVIAGEQEVVLLARELWNRPVGEEIARLSRAATASAIRGAFSSRSPRSFGFQGAPNVLWAEREKLLYTELLGRGHLHPHRFPALRADGTIEILNTICLPWYENLEPLLDDGARLRATVARFSAIGGLMQLRTDPRSRTREHLSRLHETEWHGAERWTLGHAAAWWSRTHDRSRLGLRMLGQGRFVVAADESAEGVVVELLHPDGSVTEHEVAGNNLEVKARSGVRNPVVPPGWEETWQRYEVALMAAGGTRADLPTSSTALSNRARAAEVAVRGEATWALLEEAGVGRLTDKIILSPGCGAGAGACYLAWRARPELLVGVDADDRLLRAARQATTAVGLDHHLRFVLSELEALREIPTHSVDIVIADDLLVTAAGAALHRRLTELRRVLVPGGLLLVRGVLRPGLRTLRVRGTLASAGFQARRLITTVGSDRSVPSWSRELAIRARSLGDPAPRVEIPAPAPRTPVTRARVDFPEDIPAVFAHHVRRHLGPHGETSMGKEVGASSTLAVAQAREHLSLLRELLGILTIEDLHVLELGCGFGAVAAQLAVVGQPASLIAVDTDAARLQVAQTCTDELALSPPVELRQLPAGSLEGIPDESIDIALVEEAHPVAELSALLGELGRVLVPGGAALLRHTIRGPGTPLRHHIRAAGLSVRSTRKLPGPADSGPARVLAVAKPVAAKARRGRRATRIHG